MGVYCSEQGGPDEIVKCDYVKRKKLAVCVQMKRYSGVCVRLCVCVCVCVGDGSVVG